jgi:hypothetical protein
MSATMLRLGGGKIDMSTYDLPFLGAWSSVKKM